MGRFLCLNEEGNLIIIHIGGQQQQQHSVLLLMRWQGRLTGDWRLKVRKYRCRINYVLLTTKLIMIS